MMVDFHIMLMAVANLQPVYSQSVLCLFCMHAGLLHCMCASSTCCSCCCCCHRADDVCRAVEMLPPYIPSAAEKADPVLYAANIRKLIVSGCNDHQMAETLSQAGLQTLVKRACTLGTLHCTCTSVASYTSRETSAAPDYMCAE
jgi:hypothetical protein